MTFQFKTTRTRSRRVEVETYTPPRPAAAEEAIGKIQGITPDSRQEYWAGVWLEAKKIDFKFQYRAFAGAKYFYDIDFMVYTRPLATMIELNGGFWHEGELGADDRKRQLEIEDAMRDIAKIPIQFLWADDMISRETVEQAMERIFRAT